MAADKVEDEEYSEEGSVTSEDEDDDDASSDSDFGKSKTKNKGSTQVKPVNKGPAKKVAKG